MVRATIPAMLFLVATLAGCTDGGDDDGSGGTMDGGDGMTETMSIEAPVWEVGDAWTWKFDFGNGVSEDFHVVSEVSGGNYIVDSTDELTAFEFAHWGNPTYGPMRVSDLAMRTSLGETSVWFDFPLQVGKEWSTDWFGDRLTNSVVEVDDQGAFIETYDDTGALSSYYTYSTRTEWFGTVTFLDEAGEEAGVVTITKESDYTGDVVRADVTEMFSDHGTGPHQNNQGIDFSQASDDSQVYGMAYLSCLQGIASVSFGNAEGGGGMGNLAAICPDGGFHLYGAVPGDHKQGNWGVILDVASAEAVWGVDVWLAEFERIQVQA